MKKSELKELLRSTQAALEALQAQMAAQNVKDGGPPLSDWLNIFEAQVRGKPEYSDQTIKNRLVLISHCRRLWGNKPIKSLRPHEITTAIRDEFISRGKTSTAQRTLSELKEIYTEAIANEWCEHNPAMVVKKPRHRVKRERLPFDVWLKMLDRARAHPVRWIQCMLLLAVVTSQRRADVGKATFGDVYDGHLHVEQQKKAGKIHGARVAIPLTLRLDAIGMTLGDIIELCRQSGAMLEDEAATTLVRKANGKPLNRSSLSARFRELIVAELGPDAYEVDCWPSLHECRSLAARVFKAQKVNTQTLLGHKHAEMTAVYEDDRGLSAAVFKRVEMPSHSGQAPA